MSADRAHWWLLQRRCRSRMLAGVIWVRCTRRRHADSLHRVHWSDGVRWISRP